MKTYTVTYEVRARNIQVEVEAETMKEAMRDEEAGQRAIENADGWLEWHVTKCTPDTSVEDEEREDQ